MVSLRSSSCAGSARAESLDRLKGFVDQREFAETEPQLVGLCVGAARRRRRRWRGGFDEAQARANALLADAGLPMDALHAAGAPANVKAGRAAGRRGLSLFCE